MNKRVTLGFILLILIIGSLIWFMFYKSMNNQKGSALDPNKETTSIATKNEGKFTIEVKNKQGELIQGIKFILYDNKMKEVITFTTNSNGQGSVKNLAYGQYYFKQDGTDKTESFELKETQKTVTLKRTIDAIEQEKIDEE